MNKSEMLAQAAFDGDLDLVTSLLQAGVDIDAPGRNCNPLHAAIENMEVEVVRYLLESGADTEFECYGMKALHHAIEIEIDAATQANKPDPAEPVLTQMLLEAGADINGLDSRGSTPLQMARSRSHSKAVELLESRVYRRAP